MDLYTFLMFLGAAGLLTMALQGIGGGHGDGHGHGHGDGGGHAGHAHSGHGHAGHGHSGHGHTGHGHSQAGHEGHAGSQGQHGHEGGVSRFFWSFISPRALFSIALGAGVAGRLMHPMFGGVPLAVAAIGIGIIFERAFVNPIWNFMFRFASKPALMLESCVDEEGTAVTSFDKNGQGIIAVDLDGQVVQMLATLSSDDRALGAAVRAGDRLRVADVDSARNRCTVAVL